jgi:hypothetical protein
VWRAGSQTKLIGRRSFFAKGSGKPLPFFFETGNHTSRRRNILRRLALFIVKLSATKT